MYCSPGTAAQVFQFRKIASASLEFDLSPLTPCAIPSQCVEDAATIIEVDILKRLPLLERHRPHSCMTAASNNNKATRGQKRNPLPRAAGHCHGIIHAEALGSGVEEISCQGRQGIAAERHRGASQQKHQRTSGWRASVSISVGLTFYFIARAPAAVPLSQAPDVTSIRTRNSSAI